MNLMIYKLAEKLVGEDYAIIAEGTIKDKPFKMFIPLTFKGAQKVATEDLLGGFPKINNNPMWGWYQNEKYWDDIKETGNVFLVTQCPVLPGGKIYSKIDVDGIVEWPRSPRGEYLNEFTAKHILPENYELVALKARDALNKMIKG